METAGERRHNCFQHFFSVQLFFLLLLEVVCSTCGPAYSDTTGETNSVDLFVADKTMVSERPNDGTFREVKRFELPFLVGADGLIVAFVEEHYPVDGNVNVGILARYIEIEGRDWAKKITEGNGINWKTQLAMQKEKAVVDYIYALRNPIAVAKGDKIYLLLVGYKKRERIYDPPTLKWNFEMVVGTIRPINESQGTGITIDWQIPESALSKLNAQFKKQLLRVLSGGSSAFLTKDGKIVFIVRAKKENRDVSAIIYSNKTGEELEFEWSYVEYAEGCYSPSFFPWEEKLIKIIHCPGGIHWVKESTDMGKTWSDAVGSISRLWSNLQFKEEFTTASINNKTVLIFTQRRITRMGADLKYEIYLWFTDTNRVHEIGPIAIDVNAYTSTSLLYTNGELFSLHQKWNKGSKNIILTHLKDELEKIKSVLMVWVKRDEYLSRTCNETAPQNVFSDYVCITSISTDGLVAFLSNTTSEGIWQDEYLYVNATVKGGTKVENGFTFHGSGSGAQWLVGERHPHIRYNFAKYGLTVVATVIIHEIPEGDSYFLTIGGIKDCERIRLGYDNDTQLKVIYKGCGEIPVSRSTMEYLQTNQTYKVALMLHNNRVFVILDGRLVGRPLRVSALGEEQFDIQHLFIGGYFNDSWKNADTFSHVTITNVLLYNRPLKELKDIGDNYERVHVGEALFFLLSLWSFITIC